MITEPIRDKDLLEEPFKTKLKFFLEAMEKIDPMDAHETIRTDERQSELRNLGKSFVIRSNHQDGLAADLHFTKGEAFPPAGDSRWVRAAEVAKKFGIDNGGVLWNGFDWNHFQDDGSPDQYNHGLSPWQIEARHWAMLNNVSNGERPLYTISRVENMEMIRKYHENFFPDISSIVAKKDD